MEYLTEQRLSLAKKLLITTNLRLSEIAFDIGYNDPNYFSFLFKKTTDFTQRVSSDPPLTEVQKNQPNLIHKAGLVFRLANNARSKIVERTKSILASCLQPFVILFLHRRF
ncbi:helix-turn-helix domain-containing protein [Enterococcus gallinarum]|nr:helix-turn-helix domain-containing protein [Enterococcus gallinarum]